MMTWTTAPETHPAADGRSWAERWVVETLVAVLMGFLLWQGAVVWLQSNQAITHYPQALDWATLPRPAAGYLTTTASVLDREQPGRFAIGHRVRYVGPTVRSTGPFEVSVNPIDANTWTAVALGDNGRCYATLLYSDPRNSDYGGTEYGVLSGRSPCRGIEANRHSVNSEDYPQ
jgi:hypothetical protein